MERTVTGFLGKAVYSLVLTLFVLTVATAVCAQVPGKDVMQDAAKDAAKEAVKDAAKDAVTDAAKEGTQEAVKGAPASDQPIKGQAEMVDGAKMMNNGRKTLRQDLVKNGKLEQGAALEGGTMMSEGHDMMVDGDKLVAAQKIAVGKKKMMDGARMMSEAKQKMLDDLAKKGLIESGKPSEGETMMNEGEKMMKKGEMMMLR